MSFDGSDMITPIFCVTQLSKGLYLEALSIELVLLAIWKEALDACSLLMDASDGENFSKSSQEHSLPKSGHSHLNVAV